MTLLEYMQQRGNEAGSLRLTKLEADILNLPCPMTDEIIAKVGDTQLPARIVEILTIAKNYVHTTSLYKKRKRKAEMKAKEQSLAVNTFARADFRRQKNETIF